MELPCRGKGVGAKPDLIPPIPSLDCHVLLSAILIVKSALVTAALDVAAVRMHDSLDAAAEVLASLQDLVSREDVLPLC